ncbi:MAG TPA: universal stress protein [Gemmatimonadales bacterium]|nr:universal stress protein [Gemmatimonadales bacterium]
MRIRHLVVATDASLDGNHAVRVAQSVGERIGAKVTPLLVHFPLPAGVASTPFAPIVEELPAGTAVTEGIPAIEIVRFAETQAADLIVLSRSPRDYTSVLTLGDTVDAVIRRTEIPCLVVPAGQQRFARLVAALDGSERGMAVFQQAWQFRRLSEAGLSAIFVEPLPEGEHAGLATVPSARGPHLALAMGVLLAGRAAVPLIQRQGEVVAQVTDGLSAVGGDVLMVGVRRGGPAGLSGSTGIGRRLIAAAPCAVLTVPL